MQWQIKQRAQCRRSLPASCVHYTYIFARKWSFACAVRESESWNSLGTHGRLCLCFVAVSHTTDDLVFVWDPSVPLVVDDRIELPQLDIVDNSTGDCTQLYSTGKHTLYPSFEQLINSPLFLVVKYHKFYIFEASCLIFRDYYTNILIKWPSVIIFLITLFYFLLFAILQYPKNGLK